MKTQSQLVLSLFHGVDLFGRGFERCGFTVVRAAEKIFGFDIRDLHLPSGRFDGIIAGTPCQSFSLANRNRTHKTNNCECLGCEMLKEFTRAITEAAPKWFLLENVPTVPDIHVSGYSIQRIDLNARECGLKQNRLRHFQFGSIDGRVLTVERDSTAGEFERCCTATEGKKNVRRTFTAFCELQGLPPDFDLPSFTVAGKYSAVGNGVPLPMAERMAKAICESTSNLSTGAITLCACNCGRRITGRQKSASPACRKRLQMRRASSTQNSEHLITL